MKAELKKEDIKKKKNKILSVNVSEKIFEDFNRYASQQQKKIGCDVSKSAILKKIIEIFLEENLDEEEIF